MLLTRAMHTCVNVLIARLRPVVSPPSPGRVIIGQPLNLRKTGGRKRFSWTVVPCHIVEVAPQTAVSSPVSSLSGTKITPL